MHQERAAIEDTPVIDDAVVEEIAEIAEANTRSVWKRLAGGKVRGRVAARLDRAIALKLHGKSEPKRAA